MKKLTADSLLTYPQAFEIINAGGKVRRKAWVKFITSIQMVNDRGMKYLRNNFQDGLWTPTVLTYEDMFAEDWQYVKPEDLFDVKNWYIDLITIVEEDKKTVRKFLEFLDPIVEIEETTCVGKMRNESTMCSKVCWHNNFIYVITLEKFKAQFVDFKKIGFEIELPAKDLKP